MKFCQSHWDQLRDAIKSKGMWKLVPQSGRAAAENLLNEMKGTAQPKDYDPLMSCHWMIMTHAVQRGGLYLMGQKPDGTHYCPLCEVELHRAELGEGASEWIDGATDGALEYCRSNGLVEKIQ